MPQNSGPRAFQPSISDDGYINRRQTLSLVLNDNVPPCRESVAGAEIACGAESATEFQSQPLADGEKLQRGSVAFTFPMTMSRVSSCILPSQDRSLLDSRQPPAHTESKSVLSSLGTTFTTSETNSLVVSLPKDKLSVLRGVTFKLEA